MRECERELALLVALPPPPLYSLFLCLCVPSPSSLSFSLSPIVFVPSSSSDLPAAPAAMSVTACMDDVHHKLSLLNYPRSSAPSQSLLYAGLERYALLDWLFFRYFTPSLIPSPSLLSHTLFTRFTPSSHGIAGCSATSPPSLNKTFLVKEQTATKKLHEFSVSFFLL